MKILIYNTFKNHVVAWERQVCVCKVYKPLTVIKKSLKEGESDLLQQDTKPYTALNSALLSILHALNLFSEVVIYIKSITKGSKYALIMLPVFY